VSSANKEVKIMNRIHSRHPLVALCAALATLVLSAADATAPRTG
jgi:hypothetical protein